MLWFLSSSWGLCCSFLSSRGLCCLCCSFLSSWGLCCGFISSWGLCCDFLSSRGLCYGILSSRGLCCSFLSSWGLCFGFLSSCGLSWGFTCCRTDSSVLFEDIIRNSSPAPQFIYFVLLLNVVHDSLPQIITGKIVVFALPEFCHYGHCCPMLFTIGKRGEPSKNILNTLLVVE